jgi:CelD/BcsL family acetyltransferase involved in cellulose biosynthesis
MPVLTPPPAATAVARLPGPAAAERSEDRTILFRAVEGWDAAREYLPAWRELAGEANPWVPFLEPDWSILWWRHWARRGAWRNDRFLLWLGHDARGELRALLPTVLSERPGAGPLRLRVLRPVGPDPNVTELLPILCRPEDTVPAHEGFWRILRAGPVRWDAFRWAAVPSSVAGALCKTPGVEHLRDLPDYVLPLGESWEAFRSRLPRNVKEAMRKARNAPQRDGLALDFSVEARSQDVSRVLPDFFALHSARGAVRGMRRHPNIFALPEARAFLADVAERWPQGFLAFVLRHGDRVIACRLAFHKADKLYLYYSGFDPAYARYSVMTRTLAEALEWACGQGIRRVNLSTGTDVAKTRWRPLCVEYQTLWVFTPTAAGRLTRLLSRLVRKRYMR